MKQKIRKIVLCIGLAVCCCLAGCSATETENKNKEDALMIPDFIVEVESGRNPVVLQLTDPQILDAAQQRVPNRISDGQANYYATNRMESNCFKYIRKTIEETKPDLILITGDLVYGEFDDAGTSFLALIEFMETFEIPWAPVFGNHDNESKKGVDWQCAQLEAAEHCLFKQRTLTGNGNYTVGIKQDGALKRVFFMVDSNGCGAISEESRANGHTVTQQGFELDQINWYTETATSITELSPSTKISFAFHIQPAVFEEIGKRYGFDGSTPVDIDQVSEKDADDFGYIGANLKSAWDQDRSIWNGLKALGVDSIFVGHEHCNSASIVYEGVRLQFGQKSSTYDRLNWVKRDGSIVSVYPPVSAFPMVGGTVIPLSQKDGSICDPYIYMCENER